MFGAIILRDVPKEEARIDAIHYDIQGGFRGFGMVPPAAWHYVSVKSGAHHIGFWCYLKPQQVVVKMFNDAAQQFEDADTETQVQYTQLALSGAMGPALIPYPHTSFGAWYGMVRHIPTGDALPQLHAEESGDGSRFDKALHGTHGGNAEAFLAELQSAFVKWYVSVDAAAMDDAAFNRWRHLVLAAYNAGEDAIRESGNLFADLVDTLLCQFDVLPDEWFTVDSFLASHQAGYMCEDMEDTGLPELVAKSEAFAAYIKKRRY